MNTHEAQGKAYFIVASLAEGIAEHLPEAFERAAQESGVSPEEMDAVRHEMKTTVVEYLRSQGKYHRFLASKPGKKTRKGGES